MARGKNANQPRRLLWPVMLAASCLFVWASLLTFHVADAPNPDIFPNSSPTQNACGAMGAWIAYELFYWLGDGAYPLALFASFAAALWLVNGRVTGLYQRAFGVTLLVACTATSVALVSRGGGGSLFIGDGGVLGVALSDALMNAFAKFGTVLVLFYSFIVGVAFTSEGWLLRFPSAVRRLGDISSEALALTRERAAGALAFTAGTAGRAGTGECETDAQTDEPRINPNRRARRPADNTINETQDLLFDDEPAGDKSAAPKTRKTQPTADDDDAAEHADPPTAAKRPEPIVNFPKPLEPVPDAAYPTPVDSWLFPPLSMLHEPETGFTAQQESIVRAKARMLEQTLEEFRLEARVVEIDTGPVITMFEIQIGAGIKVSQVASLSNDIARALKAPAVRVVAPIPGKNTVGIEVPNVDKEKVRVRELLDVAGGKAAKMALPLLLGKDASGAALIADLAAMPHMLIAGTTGSGKSVCINSLIASFLMTKKPDEVKLILVDPKMVEMSQFKEVPHLMSPIITDMARAEQILDWAVTKMEERYELLAEARVRNIATYNKLGSDEIYDRFQPTTDDEKAKIPVKLPYVVIIIDELADLMMTSAKEVEHHLARLAQKSRAVGIHIVVATQRPEAKVVTGLIKSNLPCRCAFRVASRMDSRIVLDQNGAEVLMGQGDMLFLPPGSHKLVRAQGTLLEDDELHRIIEFLAAQARPEYHPQLMRIKPKGMGDMSERDPMFDDAVKIVLESKRGSVSLLQRRLSIGYSRASRLIEQMAEAGIVGDFKGSQAREVVITEEDWDSLRSDRDRADAEDQQAAARQAQRASPAAPLEADEPDEATDKVDEPDDDPDNLTEDSENESDEEDLDEDVEEEDYDEDEEDDLNG